MEIAVGTTSEKKISYLKQVLKFNNIKDYSLHEFEVESNVPKQPLSELATITGAVNRAVNALKKIESQDDSMAIGLEGGLEFIDKGKVCNYICVASLCYKGHIYTGIGKRLEIPQEVAQKVKLGAELCREIRDFQPTTLETARNVERIISREEMFKDAIEDAFKQAGFK